MKNRNDKQFYKVHKSCFKCVILKEDKLKREGKFEATIIFKNNEIDNFKDFKDYVKDKLMEKNDF